MTRIQLSASLALAAAALLLNPILCLAGAEEVASFFEQAKLTNAGELDDLFGWSVAVFGDTAVIGAYRDDEMGIDSGSAYVFQRDVGGADAWGQVAKLTAADAEPDAFFGSVSVFGDTAVIGAFRDDEMGIDSGSAYVFHRDAGGPGAWGQVAKITATDAGATDAFGWSVSLSDDTVVIGAFGDDDLDTNAGSAYVFQRDVGDPDSWGQVAKLTAPDAGFFHEFGRSVAVSGDTAVIGASGAANRSGSAYVFQRDVGGLNAWGQVARLTAPDGMDDDDRFAVSVALAGDTAVIGAYRDDEMGNDSGSAYVFQRDVGGADAWGPIAKLTAADGDVRDYFGWSVALSDDTAVIGAPGDVMGSRTGSAYVFRRDLGGPDAWGQIAKFTAADGAEGDDFGDAVALSGETAVIGSLGGFDMGSRFGSAYIFRETLINPDFSLAGVCPGEGTLTVSGVTPRGRIRLWGALGEGTSIVSTGPCFGTELGLDAPGSWLLNRADEDGGKVTVRTLPDSRCGAFLQLLDETTCAMSEVVPIPDSR